MKAPIWLALHLPALALEALASCPSPSAVVAQGRILIADAAAQRAGVTAGIGVSSARALLPALSLRPRDPERESAAVQAVACWAGRFTPRVSLAGDTVLLEIGRCLRLFGGLRALVTTIGESAAALDLTVSLAVAPTPLAAHWLALSGVSVACTAPARLPPHLDPLPVTLLPARAAAALQGFGAATLGAARRLPAAALARRIGADAVCLLARAFGELPDPRPDFVFPEHFSMSLPLPAAVEHAPVLVFAARRLVAALSGWLTARQAGVRAATLRLRHVSGETALALGFSDAIADAARFERVLREKLDRLTLTAPVESLCLDAVEVVARPGRDGGLFGDAGGEHERMGALRERLGARLGEGRVFFPVLGNDHRPEAATQCSAQPAAATLPGPPLSPRPLWLLAAPESLREVAGRPCRGGGLELLSGPERIESGWWDEGEGEGDGKNDSVRAATDIRRDYFIARDAAGRALWIFREGRPPGGWFLHGFFS